MSTLISGRFIIPKPLFIITGFFLLLVPLLPGLSVYHGDENFYTNAAIRMVQTGDYLTPYYLDGATRFRKPVLTYWVIALSYKLFGISYLSSRIPFLLAGCILIWMTWKTTLALFQRQETALLSVILIGSNIQTLTVAVRSTPDILQALFLSISLYGFVKLIFSRERATLGYACAYLGAALAIATKGTLGLFPVIYSFLFCFVRRDISVRARDLINIRIILMAAMVSLSWFAAMYYEHGFTAIKGFYGDQVGERLSGSKMYILENVVEYLWAVIRHFAPWTLMILIALPRDRYLIGSFYKENREKCIYIVGWFLLLFIVFSCANLLRARYLFPAYPLLACLFAAILQNLIEDGQASRLLDRIPSIILPAGLAAGGILIILAFVVSDYKMLVGGLLFLTITLCLHLTMLKKDTLSALMGIGLFLILITSFFRLFISPVFLSSPAPRLAERLLELNQTELKLAAVGVDAKLIGKLELLMGGELEVKLLPEQAKPEELASYSAVLLSNVPDSYRTMLSEQGYRLMEFDEESKDSKLRKIWTAVTGHQEQAVPPQTGKSYYLAIKIPGRHS